MCVWRVSAGPKADELPSPSQATAAESTKDSTANESQMGSNHALRKHAKSCAMLLHSLSGEGEGPPCSPQEQERRGDGPDRPKRLSG